MLGAAGPRWLKEGRSSSSNSEWGSSVRSARQSTHAAVSILAASDGGRRAATPAASRGEARSAGRCARWRARVADLRNLRALHARCGAAALRRPGRAPRAAAVTAGGALRVGRCAGGRDCIGHAAAGGAAVHGPARRRGLDRRFRRLPPRGFCVPQAPVCPCVAARAPAPSHTQNRLSR